MKELLKEKKNLLQQLHYDEQNIQDVREKIEAECNQSEPRKIYGMFCNESGPVEVNITKESRAKLAKVLFK